MSNDDRRWFFWALAGVVVAVLWTVVIYSALDRDKSAVHPLGRNQTTAVSAITRMYVCIQPTGRSFLAPFAPTCKHGQVVYFDVHQYRGRR